MTDLWRLDAAQMADGFRSGAFTPPDALDACLARAAAWQPHTNAMVLIDEPGARQAARASAGRWAGGHPLGPLDGVPVTLKDNLHAAGWPTTWGSRLLDTAPQEHDELPVARLRAAGAVLLGKTNLPEFATQGYTHNALHGTTRNPWDVSLTPGGSSGGAVAAVASGCGPLALVTDGGGSARRPASHAGLVGFKPSGGAVQRAGGLPEIFLDYEVPGVIGRSVRDVTLLMRAIAVPGTLPANEEAATARIPAARILYVPRFAAHPVDPGIAAQVHEAAGRLEAMGHHLETSGPFNLAEEVNTLWPVLSQTGLAMLFAQHPGWDASQCMPAIQAMLREGHASEAGARDALFAAIDRLETGLHALFTQHDFILTPATAALPWPAAQTHPGMIDGRAAGPRGHAVFTAFANAAGLPAIAVPSGWVQGLPTGFQLVGRRGDDARLLSLALQYETHHPRPQAWPELPA